MVNGYPSFLSWGWITVCLKEQELVLKASVARNYHQPTLNDLYWQPNGNPELLPEMGFTMEAGMDYQKSFGNQRLKTGLTWYRSLIENWIMWIPSSRMNLEPINIKEVLSTGLEYDLVFQGEIRKFSLWYFRNLCLHQFCEPWRPSGLGR